MEKINKLPGYKTKNRVLSLIGNVLFFTVVGVLFTYFLVNTIDVRTGYSFPFFGLRDSVIVSESMSEANPENTYLNDDMKRINKYDLIITSNYKSYEDIELYDVVTYKSGNNLICHRVVYLFSEDGTDYIVTRGDSNDANDNPVAYSEVRGQVINVIPNVGRVFLFMQSGYALLAVFGSLFFFLLAEFIGECTKYSEYKGLKGYVDAYEEDRTFILNGELFNSEKHKKTFALTGGDNHYVLDNDKDELVLYRVIRTDYKKKDSNVVSSGIFPYAEIEDTLLESIVPIAFKKMLNGYNPLTTLWKQVKRKKLFIKDKNVCSIINEKVFKRIKESNIYSDISLVKNDDIKYKKLFVSYTKTKNYLKRKHLGNNKDIMIPYSYLLGCLKDKIDPTSLFVGEKNLINIKEVLINV